MKKFLLTGIIVLMCSSPSWAFYDFNYTGIRAEKNDITGYGPISPGFIGANWVGGNAANNSLGYAKQFTVEDITEIKELTFDASVQNWNYPFPNHLGFYFRVYSGTTTEPYFAYNKPIPDINTLIQNKKLTLNNSERNDAMYDDYILDYKVLLIPGTYWLAYERDFVSDGSAVVLLNNIQYGVTAVNTPEPTSILLLGGGLVGMIVRRRKII